MTPDPTVEARAALIEWMDSPCPHYNTPDADSKNECYLCIDTFRQAGVEQAEKALKSECDQKYRLIAEAINLQERIASLEAELARVREERDAAYAIRDAGWEQTEGVIKERDALRARLSPERLEKVADAIVEALMGSLRPAPSMTAVILAVLQRELGKEK